MTKSFNKICLPALIVLVTGIVSSCSSTNNGSPEIMVEPSGKVSTANVVENLPLREESGSRLNVDSADASTKSLGEDPSLDEYLLFALKSSSELKSAYETYQAALQKSPQVSALPDPRLNFGYFLKEVETRVGPQEQKVGVMQPIPWFGKLSLKGDIADSEAKAALYAFLAKKNKLVASVTAAYFELAYLRSATEITDANFELLKRWEQALAQRYRSQTGTQANLIKVQVELGTLEDKLKELRELREPLLARFNALLNRSAFREVFLSKGVLASSLDTAIARVLELNQEALEAQLSQSNPDLLYVDALIEARERGIKLAHKNFYPDFGIGADYIFVGDREQAGGESGDDALVTMFSITLPLYRSKYKAGLSQAKSQKRSAKQMKAAKKYALSSELAKNVFEIKDSKRRIKLYRDTLCQVPRSSDINSSKQIRLLVVEKVSVR